jgi:rod shape-determining protein MreD
MAWLRALLLVVLVVTAVILEVSVLPLLGLPGAVPDSVTVTVIAVGVAAGPVRGATTGFLAGVLLDLVPPADGVLGLTAVVLVFVGYLAGLLGANRDRSPIMVVLATGVLAGGAVLGLALVGGVVGDPRVAWDRVLGLMLTQAAYAVVLAAFVVPLVGALWRRVAPPATPRYDLGRQ